MSELIIGDLPPCLKSPDTLVGISSNSVVVGYVAHRILAKLDLKAKERSYRHRHRALVRVRSELRDRQRIREHLQRHSNSPDIVPCIDVVIHNGQNGDISYSEIQEWYQGSRTLAEAGWSVLSGKLENLEDLRLIFASSIKHYRKTGDLYDIQGTVLNLNPFQKIVSALLPLFSSTNVVIDRDGHIRFVDADMLKGKGLPLRTRLHRQVKLVGSFLSVRVLDAAIFVKKTRSSSEREFG